MFIIFVKFSRGYVYSIQGATSIPDPRIFQQKLHPHPLNPLVPTAQHLLWSVYMDLVDSGWDSSSLIVH